MLTLFFMFLGLTLLALLSFACGYAVGTQSWARSCPGCGRRDCKGNCGGWGR